MSRDIFRDWYYILAPDPMVPALINLTKISRLSKMRRRHLKYVLFACVCVIVYIFFGVSDYILAKSFEDNFDYPLNVNIKSVVNDVLAGKKASVKPINYYPYRFLTNSGKCFTTDQLDLFIVVKSAMDHFEHRDAIRKTFGRENVPGRTVRTLFFLGIDSKPKSDLQKKIDKEMVEFKDIIQIDFIDNYYNNTIKTMMSFRWLYEYCSTADYYLFTDDDMYISVNNLLAYIHDREATRKPAAALSAEANDMALGTTTAESETDCSDCLFTGYVFKSTPQRFKSSKWRVSLEEYPWDKWPAYVTAGAYVVSNKAMKVMYVASLFVKHFRFDDIYLGIVAKKAGITPTHCPDFHFYKKEFCYSCYLNVIASHGYGNQKELLRVWNEMNST